MMSTEDLRSGIVKAASTVVSVGVLLAMSVGSVRANPAYPICDGAIQSQCVLETFVEMDRQSYGNSFTSPAGFDFEIYWGPSAASLKVADVMGGSYNELRFGCYGTMVELPEPRDYVTFVYGADSVGTKVQFTAVDTNGQAVDTEIIENKKQTLDTITLYGGARIEAVFMKHLEFSPPPNAVCKENCREPWIARIKACDKR